MTRVIVIPAQGAPSERTINKTNHLKEFQAIVKGSITMCPVNMKEVNGLELTLYANDEGMMIPLSVNKNLENAYVLYKFYGDIVLTACDPETGDEVSLPPEVTPENWATFIRD